jgi:hypothetical protein
MLAFSKMMSKNWLCLFAIFKCMYIIFKNNNCPTGENSPNLVALIASVPSMRTPISDVPTLENA